MEEQNIEQRLIDIEMSLANQEKSLDDLNEVVIKQGKVIDLLLRQNKVLLEAMAQDTVKPQSEETPPPHY